jgi:hypothetical protein
MSPNEDGLGFGVNLLDALLGPLEIPLGFAGCLESFVEIGSDALKTALGQGLQLKQFLLLCVEPARTVSGTILLAR